MDLDENVSYIIQSAKPKKFKKFDGSKYLHLVPKPLITIWERCGIASWAGGAFQTCDPESIWDSVREALEGNQHLEADETVPYLISAFGIAKAWNSKVGSVNIEFPKNRIVYNTNLGEISPDKVNDVEFYSSFPLNKRYFRDFGLLDAAISKFGPLDELEIYGFVPALSLGGKPSIFNVERLRADVHLSILSQSDKFKEVYLDDTNLNNLKYLDL
ncbi:T6SS immunity protein Tdi1 domain-containing protein [Methylobacterium radiotolerans]|uniref:T6SS immunity protein Tdi1 domain-containing protein n=1 Tax=Methylobacterium radiotolerans TaxID=31998 RepID=UPI000E310991|nr:MULTISPECIES: T6SS immunity protein Tdi1 domain-containing protein [Methylobacterium]MDE3750125.1 GAD-like domain-containing protein [Methylobacterium radiotolerans]